MFYDSVCFEGAEVRDGECLVIEREPEVKLIQIDLRYAIVR